MKNGRKHPTADGFIAPAKRAFRRVARQIRAEHARAGVPLVLGEHGRIKLVHIGQSDRVEKRSSTSKGTRRPTKEPRSK